MPTVASVIEHLKTYHPDEHIAAPIWTETDVLITAKERHQSISMEQAQSILDQLDSNHNAEIGITWDSINSALDELLS